MPVRAHSHRPAHKVAALAVLALATSIGCSEVAKEPRSSSAANVSLQGSAPVEGDGPVIEIIGDDSELEAGWVTVRDVRVATMAGWVRVTEPGQQLSWSLRDGDAAGLSLASSVASSAANQAAALRFTVEEVVVWSDETAAPEIYDEPFDVRVALHNRGGHRVARIGREHVGAWH